MNILMIDTSGPACGVAIMADGRLVYEAELTHRQTHSQRVMPMVDTALQMSDMTAADMDVFGAVVGPGSFTGWHTRRVSPASRWTRLKRWLRT